MNPPPRHKYIASLSYLRFVIAFFIAVSLRHRCAMFSTSFYLEYKCNRGVFAFLRLAGTRTEVNRGSPEHALTKGLSFFLLDRGVLFLTFRLGVFVVVIVAIFDFARSLKLTDASYRVAPCVVSPRAPRARVCRDTYPRSTSRCVSARVKVIREGNCVLVSAL